MRTKPIPIKTEPMMFTPCGYCQGDWPSKRIIEGTYPDLRSICCECGHREKFIDDLPESVQKELGVDGIGRPATECSYCYRNHAVDSAERFRCILARASSKLDKILDVGRFDSVSVADITRLRKKICELEAIICLLSIENAVDNLSKEETV